MKVSIHFNKILGIGVFKVNDYKSEVQFPKNKMADLKWRMSFVINY